MARLRLRNSLVLALLVACGSEEAKGFAPNPGFERWCDKHPCGWDVEGDFEQVGTWHPNDYAIELLGDDAVASQLRAELDSKRATCLEFSLMAKISANAHAFLELDFLDDGVIEFSERIPESDWEVRKFTIHTPDWYQGVRFSLRKQGEGKVVLAELNVELIQSGCAATPLELLGRPSKAPCRRDEECSSGHCDGAACD